MTPAQRSAILFVVLAASVPVFEALVRLDAEAVLRDPRTWLVGVLAAAVRAGAGAVLARIVERQVTPRG